MGWHEYQNHRRGPNTTAALWIASVLLFALLLGAYGMRSREGKPTPGPNVAIAQAYLDSVGHPGESVRAYGCRIGSPMPLLFYVILFPGKRKQGLLLIYAPPFNLIPRAQSVSFNPATHAWRLVELPNTDWSFHHLSALRMIKYGSNNQAIEAKFNKIMASAPTFGELTDVKLAPLLYTPAGRPWLVTPCP